MKPKWLAQAIIVICNCIWVLGEISANLKPLEWIIGTWEGDFHGKVRWPTIPTMTYGEIISIAPAPIAADAGIQFLNYTYQLLFIIKSII
jgi:hypothetical protein